MNITGERLRKLRESMGLSQGEVAEIIKITRPAYVAYETGRTKPSRRIKELSELFGVSADYILGVDETPGTPDMPRKPRELLEILAREEYTLNGQLATPEDREKMKRIVEALYWDAKAKNKRK